MSDKLLSRGSDISLENILMKNSETIPGLKGP